MTKLLCLIGLPASSKTTHARKLESEGWIRVNKDDIRAKLSKICDSCGRFERDELHSSNGPAGSAWHPFRGWSWSHENEKDVIKLRDEAIIEGLKAGKNVVSDDCNFGKHKKRLSTIARELGVED